MRSADVVRIYRTLEEAGVSIWIDGGWAVDAALGRQTRAHDDLDIVVESSAVDTLKKYLSELGFNELDPESTAEWNFVLSDDQRNKVDVHIVELEVQDGVHKAPINGIAYPAGSLTGTGVINEMQVRCVRAEHLLSFKTSYPPRPKDRDDVAALSQLLGLRVPCTHVQSASRAW